MGEILLYSYNVAEFVLKPTEQTSGHMFTVRAETITNKLHPSVFYSKLSSIRGTIFNIVIISFHQLSK